MAKKQKTEKKQEPEPELSFNESWLNRYWRPAAAVVYLVICVFDFIIAPAFMGFKSSSTQQMADSIKGLDPAIAIALIQNRTPWQPLTLQGSGLFHVAFGAILGVAAWTRGMGQIETIRQQGESDRSPYTPTMVPTYYLPSSQTTPPQMVQMTTPPPVQVNANITTNTTTDTASSTQVDNPDG